MSVFVNNLYGASCFLFFALILSVNSGYKIGAFLFIFISLIFCRSFKWRYLDFKEIFFISSLLIFSILWGLSFESGVGLRKINDPFWEYLLAILLFVGAISFKIRRNFYIYGLVAGCISSAVIAVIQYESMGRAAGFTNAIRFGNLALWMACACLIFLFVAKLSNKQKFLVFLGAFFGVVASGLSLSRGGWIFFLVLPFLFLILVESAEKKIKLLLAAFLSSLVLGLVAASIPFVQTRIHSAENEVSAYFNESPGAAATSVGARLEQWRLAWQMGVEKPWSGWGEQGYLAGREMYAAKGLADKTVVDFGHAHNDFLNVFAKKGILGVVGLILVYLAPLVIFWPEKKYFSLLSQEAAATYKAVCLIGISIPVAYFIFGLTEYFFYLNIGHVFYLFSIIYTYSLLKSVQGDING